ncbi:hypothetical protein FBU31_003947 [Coemansia sp. 'formosensis']|nr:hypothetical protein FBU31_003947 [Coemansia sp. 'formosensis']
MSATITLTTTAPHSLCLFSPTADEDVRAQQPCSTAAPSLSSASSESSSASSSINSSTDSNTDSVRPGSITDTWPMAVEALAQRLWDCGREALSRRSSTSDTNSVNESKLVFDETGEVDTSAGLCDGPYVRIDYSASPPALPSAELEPSPPPLQQHVACRPPLIHYRPRTNPFKTMMRTPAFDDKSRLSSAAATSHACRHVEAKNATSPQASSPLPLASNNSPPSSSCTHCKRGNFLEFCFVADRCSCQCHDVCPCNPCLGIKDHRHHMLDSRQRVSRMPLRPSKAARVWVDDGHPQHRQPSLCTLT